MPNISFNSTAGVGLPQYEPFAAGGELILVLGDIRNDMISWQNNVLGALWLFIAAFFFVVVAGQIQLMLAPVGSDSWRHSEWAPAAAIFALIVGTPFAISGYALIRKWRWRKLWQFGPLAVFTALVGLGLFA